MAGLLGSAGHATPASAAAIAALFMTFSVGFIRPPSLTLAQVGQLPTCFCERFMQYSARVRGC
jgi:hypothetical protein